MTAPKAKPAEKSKADQAKEAGAKLNEMLETTPAPDEQPKPKKAPPKKLALSEVEGEIKDGQKIKIGVAVFAAPGVESGEYINRTLVVPAATKLVGPSARPQNVHVIDVARPKMTLCMLPTNWTSGTTEYADDHLITCEPCARRLIAVKKLKQGDHDKRKKLAEKARDDARAALAARKEADKAKAKEAAAVEAPKGETPAKTPEKVAPSGVQRTEPKPDPKPSARKSTKPAAA